MNTIRNKGYGLLRFSTHRESFIWVNPDKIIFIKSADHYVRTLLLHENNKTWTTRHSTMKEILSELTGDQFIRLNKFYIVNRNHVSHIDETAHTIFLKDGFSICCEHRISPFILCIFRS